MDYLTEEELMQFVQLYYQRTLPEKLQLTLAFFLFMCFTSMHITDARMFCIEQVNNDVLTYYRVKNRNCKPEPIKIPMPVPAEKLLEEWAEGREEGRLFRNVQCDQVVNRQLKPLPRNWGLTKKYRPRQEDIRLQLFISGKQKTYPACKNCLDIAISGKR